MSERDVTFDGEPVNQEIRQPALGKGGREVILSVVDDATSIGEVKRLAGGRSSRTAERIMVTTRSGTRPVVLKRFPADRAGAAAEWRALIAAGAIGGEEIRNLTGGARRHSCLRPAPDAGHHLL